MLMREDKGDIMVAYLVLVCPSFFTIITDMLYKKTKKEEVKQILVLYLSSLLVVNAICMTILSVIREMDENIIDIMNNYKDFSVKYFAMASVISVVVGLYANWIKKINLNRKSLKYIPEIVLWLYSIILVGLNFIRIFDNNFWGDECYSIMLSKLSIPSMIRATANNVHPPLYYLFLLFSERLFGNGGWNYHIVSMLPYCVCVIFAITIMKKKFGIISSYIFVTLISVMPNALYYNIEVRMYSLASMFILLSYYGLLKIMKEDNWKSYVFFMIMSLGAAYTHYYAMMSVAFFYLAILFLAIKKRTTWKKMCICYLVTFLVYVPWFYEMFRMVKRPSIGQWMVAPTFIEGMLYYYQHPQIWVSWMLLLATFLSFGVVCYKEALKYKEEHGKYAISDFAFWLMWGGLAALGTLLLGEIITILIRPAFITRYIYPVSVTFAVVLSVCISKLNWKKTLASVIIIVLFIVCIPPYLETVEKERKYNELCNSTQQYCLENIEDNATILTNGVHLDWTVMNYYLPEVERELVTTDYEEFKEEKTYWVIWTYGFSEKELQWLNENGYTDVKFEYSGLLGDSWVFLYRINKIEE